jgi:hypothetical protein
MAHQAQAHDSSDRDTPRVHPVALVAGAVTALSVVAAVVVLSLAGKQPDEIGALLAAALPLAGLLLAGLDKLSKTLDLTRAQTETLAAIDDRTNGKLDARIGRVVHQVLNERYGPPPIHRDAA